MNTFNEKAKLIEMGKKYRYLNGMPARILCIDRNMPAYPVLSMDTDGHLHSHPKDDHNLIEISPYDDFKIDDPVMVRSYGQVWQRRYWAGVNSEGRPLTFHFGCTSWSAKRVLGAWSSVWDEARRPTPEELEKKHD